MTSALAMEKGVTVRLNVIEAEELVFSSCRVAQSEKEKTG